jgi:large subunit ribosomal protein L18
MFAEKKVKNQPNMKLSKKKELVQKRRWRIRKKVVGTAERPRVAVRFTNKNIHAQCIDDAKGHTLLSLATTHADFKKLLPNVDGSKNLGSAFGEKIKASGLESIVFDRSGRKYHGCVKAFADSLREQGLKF